MPNTSPHVDEIVVVYLPREKILSVTVRPALCYIAPHMDDAPATSDYDGQLAEAVRAASLPEWYAELVESFGPEKEGSTEQSKNH